MKVLGIDFSSSVRSVALVDSSDGQPTVLRELNETGSRETNAFHMIEAVLGAASVDRKSVDALAIGLGPGSYGGIRVALSIAQGWQLATGLKTCGINSARAIAHTAQSDGVRGLVNVIIDAQRKEFYQASFELSDAAVTSTSGLQIVKRAELEDSVATGIGLIGPDLDTRLPEVSAVHPRARSVALLALEQEEFVDADLLEPIYIRPAAFVKAPRPRTDLLS